MFNNRLSKTFKSLLTICAAVAFLSACSTTSTPSDTGSTTGGASTSTTEVSTGGSNNGSTTAGVVAPQGNVFYFDFDSSALRADSRSLLEAHAAALKSQPRAVRLEGHADERGTREYNIALGERRAQAVRSFLQSRGVSSPIEVVSYGEERPAVDESNAYALQQNRRVEIK